MRPWSSSSSLLNRGAHFAISPLVDVRRGHQGAGPEVLGDVLETEVLLNVLLPIFSLLIITTHGCLPSEAR